MIKVIGILLLSLALAVPAYGWGGRKEFVISNVGEGVTSGTTYVKTTATVLSRPQDIYSVQIYVDSGSYGKVYAGSPDVVTASGFPVPTSPNTVRINVSNLSQLYFIGANGGEIVYFIGETR